MMKSIFEETLKGNKCERPPVWFMRQAGRVLPSYMALREKHSFREMMADPKLAAQVTLLPIYDLGVDAAILFSDILVIPEAMGMELNWTETGPRFSNPLKDEKDPLSILNPKPQKLEYIYDVIDEINNTKPVDTPLIGFCGAPFTTFCYMVQGIGTSQPFPEAVKMLYSDKETSAKILDRIADLSIEYALNQVKHGIAAFQLFETHAGLIPSKLYFEMIVPVVERILAAIKETGTPVIYFPKDLGTGLKNLPAGIADFISIDWQMPIETARELVHESMGLQGNLDPRILYADNDTIKKELESYIPFGKKEHRWIFNLGHGLMPGIEAEKVKFVVDWIKEVNWQR